MTTLLGLFTVLVALGSTTAAPTRRQSKPVKVPLTRVQRPNGPIKIDTAAARPQEGAPLEGFLWNQNYAAIVNIGEPPQPVKLVFDTGSTEIVVFAQDCSDCKRTSGLYDSSKSKTFVDTKQNFTIGYGKPENAVLGVVGQETIEIGGFTQTLQPFADIHSGGVIAEALPPGEVGILGAGWKWPQSEASTGTSWAEDAAFSLWAAPVFGVYLGKYEPDGPEQLENAGEVMFGGLDEERYKGRPYTEYPIIDAEYQRWNIELSGIRLDGELLDVDFINNYQGPSRAALIDTGAENHVLPEVVCQAMQKKIPGSFRDDLKRLVLPCNSTVAIDYKFGNIWYPTEARDNFWNRKTAQEFGSGFCISSITCDKRDDFIFQFGAAFLQNVYAGFNYEKRTVGMAPLTNRRGPWDYGWDDGPIQSSGGSSAAPTPSKSSATAGPSSSAAPMSSSQAPPNSNTASSNVTPSPSSQASQSSSNVPPSSSSQVSQPSSNVPPPPVSSTPPQPSTSANPPSSSPQPSTSANPPPPKSSTANSSQHASANTSQPPPLPNTSAAPPPPHTSANPPQPPQSVTSVNPPPQHTSANPSPTSDTQPPTESDIHPPPSCEICSIPPPTKPCPCYGGSQHWWYDGRWRFRFFGAYRKTGWRWGGQGFGLYPGKSNSCVQRLNRVTEVAESWFGWA